MINGHTQKAIEVVKDIEDNNNTQLPFIYLFKGINEFRLSNFVLAVEQFQNATKFFKYQ